MNTRVAKHIFFGLSFSLLLMSKLSATEWTVHSSTKERHQSSYGMIRELLSLNKQLWKQKADPSLKVSVGAEINREVIRFYQSDVSPKSRFTPYKMMLDHSYHGAYSAKRQGHHDKIIHELIDQKPSGLTHPVVIFMAGTMGVGKGYTRDRIGELGFYAPEDFVKIDYDDIKQKLPEYLEISQLHNSAVSKQAGSIIHAESAFVAEIAQQFAIDQRYNLIIDGSLNDLQWFEGVFKDFKASGYTIKLVYVSSDDLDVVEENANHRGKVEGRFVTRKEIEENYKAVSKTVESLKKYTDFTLEVSGGSVAKRIEPKIKSVTFYENGLVTGVESFEESDWFLDRPEIVDPLVQEALSLLGE